MTIAKYLHSCILVQDDNLTLLFDPGNYTYEAKVFDAATLTKLDYIVITHEHQDHMHIPFIKELLEKFPDAKIITNMSAQKLLQDAGIESSTEGVAGINIVRTSHEKIFGVTPPENIMFEINNTLTHPGDSLQFSLSTPILLLPVQAPWCSLTQAVEFAISQNPKVIIPIHDWHWRDEATQMFYERLEKHFSEHEIKFIKPMTGVTFTL